MRNKTKRNDHFLLSLVNDRTRSLWAGTNGGHVYVYSIMGVDSPSSLNPTANSSSDTTNNTAAIATDQTTTCTMGMLFSLSIQMGFSLIIYLIFFLAKEIRLKHKAPVLSIMVLDGANQSIGQGSGIPTLESPIVSTTISAPMTTSNENASSPTSSNSVTTHKVLICSEEQFKVNSLN